MINNITNLNLGGARFKGMEAARQVSISPTAFGLVWVRVGTDQVFTIDFEDVENFCRALRFAAIDASEGLLEDMARATANAAIERAREGDVEGVARD